MTHPDLEALEAARDAAWAALSAAMARQAEARLAFDEAQAAFLTAYEDERVRLRPRSTDLPTGAQS